MARRLRLPPLLRHHPVLTTAFALALAATLYFGVNTVMRTIYWMDPAHHAQPLEPWMTPRYIAHSWLVDGRDLARHLGVPPRPDERPTLERIAAAQGVPVEEVIDRARAYLETHGSRKRPGDE